MKYLSACPVCQEKNPEPFLACKDYTVSHETFQLERCTHCGFVMTNPRPDDNTIHKYYQSEAYISHTDKSQNVVDQTYKITRRFTLRWKYNIVQKHNPGAHSLLDFGCGTGAFLKECRARGMETFGVEPSPQARALAQSNTESTIATSAADITGSFDAITLWHVLEHVPDFHETLRTLSAHLETNGTMFVAVPNHESADAKIYGAHWAGYDVPRHLWHFTRKTMRRIVQQHHLHLVAVLPMRLDAYYVSLLSEKYQNGNNTVFNMAKALWNGFRSNQAGQKTHDFSSLIYILKK